MRVLLIEDEAHWQNVFQGAIEEIARDRATTDIRFASTPEESLESVQNHLNGRWQADLIVVDLNLRNARGDYSGLDVLRALSASPRNAVVLVWSNLAEDSTVLRLRRSENYVYDDWLWKSAFRDDSLEARIRPYIERLIDIETGVRVGGLAYRSRVMHELMRRLTRVARMTPKADMPLSRILLYGEPGSGKSRIAKAYSRMLGEPQPREFAKCSAVGLRGFEGDRALINLFGARDFNQRGNSRAGVLEMATFYGRGHKGLAGESSVPDPGRAGVAFIEELQALQAAEQQALLDPLDDHVADEKGHAWIKPVGLSASKGVRISCHIVAATSLDADFAVTERVDAVHGQIVNALLQRFQRFRIPPLRERREDTLPILQDLIVEKVRSLSGQTIDLDQIELLPSFVDRLESLEDIYARILDRLAANVAEQWIEEGCKKPVKPSERVINDAMKESLVTPSKPQVSVSTAAGSKAGDRTGSPTPPGGAGEWFDDLERVLVYLAECGRHSSTKEVLAAFQELGIEPLKGISRGVPSLKQVFLKGAARRKTLERFQDAYPRIWQVYTKGEDV